MTTNLDISKDIHSLTDFKRNTAELTEQMKTSGRPLVLTVNGKAAFVVQDASSYQEMAEAIEHATVVEGVRRGMRQIECGEGQDFDDFAKGIRSRHDFKAKRDTELAHR